jgi:hypothetical protein
MRNPHNDRLGESSARPAPDVLAHPVAALPLASRATIRLKGLSVAACCPVSMMRATV